MDSKEPQEKTYVLRKPINVEFLDDVPGGRYVTDLEIMGRDDYMWNEAQFDEEHFKAQFQPLDIDDIRKQIFEDKELFRIASLIGCDGEDWQIERRKNNLVDYVFSLITGVTLGRKQ